MLFRSSRFIQEYVLKVKLNLLVNIGVIERGTLRIVTHYLIRAASGALPTLVKMSIQGKDIPLAAFALLYARLVA